MRHMYVISKNHMDLIWRRCFQRYYDYDGYIIRSYSDIEEHLLNWWLNECERDGIHYDVEQTITLRNYLDKNPHQFERIKRLINSGHFGVLGGGESVLDYNMTDGEFIIRNHFYSRRYLQKEFSYVPKFAVCPDTFGLSAQLPQIFRQLGYTAVTSFARVFENHKPVWRGLSGHYIALEPVKTVDFFDADYVKYPVCIACAGEGCTVCSHTGIEVYYRQFDREESVNKLISGLSKASAENQNDIVFMVDNEETLEPDNFVDLITSTAEQYAYTVEFIGLDELIERKYSSLLSQVQSNSVPEELIDARVEGNPVVTGCLISRIRIKQENRRIEAFLLAAECLCTLAVSYGNKYPFETLEKLWVKAAFYQTHDGLPGSHSDHAYDELLDTAREIRMRCAQLTDQAMAKIVFRIHVSGDNGLCFVVFNPLAWDVHDVVLESVIHVKEPTDWCTLISVADNSRCTVLSVEPVNTHYHSVVKVRFVGSLPSLGYGVFSFTPESKPAVVIEDASRTIENEYYRIDLSDTGIESIYDKRLGKVIACDGVCSPVIEEDAGNLWGPQGLREYQERADKPFNRELMTPSHTHRVTVTVEKTGDIQRARINVVLDRKGVKLHELNWTMTVELRLQSDRIAFHIDVHWSAEDLRLLARFPLTFNTLEDRAIYEIPFGQLERPYQRAYDKSVGTFSEDVAALRYCCAYNKQEDWTFGLFNTGTPAHRMENGTIYVSLVRSPTRMFCSFDMEKASAPGNYSYDFAVSSWRGIPDADYPARIGWELNAWFPTKQVRVNDGNLPARKSLFMPLPENVMLSALKRSENDNGVVLRFYEPYGKHASVLLDEFVQEIDLLEQQDVSACFDHLDFAPFEIKTVIINNCI